MKIIKKFNIFTRIYFLSQKNNYKILLNIILELYLKSMEIKV